MHRKKGFVKGRLYSFRYAIQGLRSLFRSEPNVRIHLAATILAVVAGYAAGITRMEWVAVVIAAGLVWMAELFNTGIEKTMDLIQPEQDPLVGSIKDLAAGAVLVAAIVALVTGALVFIPYLF